MNGSKEIQPSIADVAQVLMRRIRVTTRWMLRRWKRRFRHFDETTGAEFRAETRRRAGIAQERLRAEFQELSDDSKQRYEKAKPEIDARLREVRQLAESFRRKFAVWLRLAVGMAILALVIFGIVWLFGSTREDQGTTVSLIYCEDCPSMAVTRIIDGDTIDTDVGRVRIYGADTPERGEKCFEEATDAMRILAGNRVRAEGGPRQVDPFGRKLYYIYTESGDSIDESLIRNGFAVAWTRDGQHRDQLIEIEREAATNDVGCLWS